MNRRRSLVWLSLTGILVAGCTALSPMALPATFTPEPTRLALPQLKLNDAPENICRDATQFQFLPLTVGPWPQNVGATWALFLEEQTTPLESGNWTPGQELFVAFPKGEPLPPGRYTIDLMSGTLRAGAHTFTVLDTDPQITDLAIWQTPDGPPTVQLPDGTRIFYLHAVYSSVCPGAPLWITVKNTDETVICTEKLTLDAANGELEVPCYHPGGELFTYGDYLATWELMGKEQYDLVFQIGEAPLPPAQYATMCTPLFAAAGLSPEGKTFRAGERFEWYTQAIFVGTSCSDLAPETSWETHWYRNGQEIQHRQGVWSGATGDLIWDSLTGLEEAPFLNPGAYSVTLEIAALAPLTTTFTILQYIRGE